jgi:hypothetical protein
MPNSAAPAACSPPASNASRLRRAQRIDSSIEAAISARGRSVRGHSSNAMTMSEPSRRWISIERSGLSMCFEPSRWLRNSTPSSVSLRSSLRLMTW